MPAERYEFSRYERFDPACPVTRVTPPEGSFIHTFFDVCLIDLEEETIEEICSTSGWGMQTAAHQCWGKTDRAFSRGSGAVPV